MSYELSGLSRHQTNRFQQKLSQSCQHIICKCIDTSFQHCQLFGDITKLVSVLKSSPNIIDGISHHFVILWCRMATKINTLLLNRKRFETDHQLKSQTLASGLQFCHGFRVSVSVKWIYLIK